MRSALAILFFAFSIFSFSSCSSYHPSGVKDHTSTISGGPQQAAADSLIYPYRNQLSASMQEVIGVSIHEMKTERPQGRLGNFVADLVYASFSKLVVGRHDSTEFNKPHLSLLNTRGLRAAIPQGDITVERIFSVMPFENEVVLVKLKLADVIKMAEYLVQVGGHPISFNGSLVAVDGKLQSMFINDKSIHALAEVWIITSDYLAEGGDGMNFFSAAEEMIYTGQKLRDVIIQYIRSETSQGKKIQAETDDRILFFR